MLKNFHNKIHRKGNNTNMIHHLMIFFCFLSFHLSFILKCQYYPHTDYNTLKIFFNSSLFLSLLRSMSVYSPLLLLSWEICRDPELPLCRLALNFGDSFYYECGTLYTGARVVVLGVATSSFRGLRQFSVYPLKRGGKWP